LTHILVCIMPSSSRVAFDTHPSTLQLRKERRDGHRHLRRQHAADFDLAAQEQLDGNRWRTPGVRVDADAPRRDARCVARHHFFGGAPSLLAAHRYAQNLVLVRRRRRWRFRQLFEERHEHIARRDADTADVDWLARE
jgi:hypothetical protein